MRQNLSLSHRFQDSKKKKQVKTGNIKVYIKIKRLVFASLFYEQELRVKTLLWRYLLALGCVFYMKPGGRNLAAQLVRQRPILGRARRLALG